ncbi:MAG: beta-galactosidase [Anaerolineae bacterium]|nr:beta-galactosidase [Anaerolineae bacterium]
MLRRFRQHDQRQVVDLRGFWDFVFLGDVNPDDVDITSLQFNDRMAVPGCFDATPKYAGRRGLVAYRTRIPIVDETPHRLILDAVHHWSRIFIDGQPLRDHTSGFTRFATDILGHEPGEAELIVLVDNRFDYERSPLHLEYFDWYHFGGIARGAELHRLGTLWIDRLQITTEDYAERMIKVAIDYAATTPPGPADMVITCDGEEILNEQVNLKDTAGRIERLLQLDGAALWSPDEPNLHLLHVRLDDDDMRERIGIRQVSVDGPRILINGQPVRLLGFNRHDAHPQFGHGLPDALLIADVQQLKDLGSNFVRGSHYPQDVRFLDLCDETGICVWNEALGWQHTAEHLTDPRFIDAQLTLIDEMVAMSFNRPSVIMWGILNESHSHDPACRPGYEKLLGRLRELDGTRPVTYASNHPLNDVCFDLVDIVSVNTYPGWYHGGIEEIPQRLDEIIAHLDAHGQADKPIIISEIGAGAVPGWRDWNETRWTEQYQARLLDTVIRHLFVDRDRVSGLSIWQFCDCRTSEQTDRILRRPRGFNNKGVLDEYRRPKLAYEVVKRHFHELRSR